MGKKKEHNCIQTGKVTLRQEKYWSGKTTEVSRNMENITSDTHKILKMNTVVWVTDMNRGQKIK